MTNIININIENINGKLYATSRDIADKLNKEHKDVCLKIKEVLTVGEFSDREFKTEKGNIYKEYLLDKDAFTLLLMNYTGFNEFKRTYIQKFNEMENKLKQQKIYSYMIDNPVDRAKLWIKETEEHYLIQNKQQEIIKEQKETLELIHNNKEERVYKKKLRSEIVALITKFCKSSGMAYNEAYREIYTKFISLYPCILWKMEFWKAENKLDFLMNLSIDYLKELKDVVISRLEIRNIS